MVKTVLMVDDSDDIRQCVSCILEKAGFNVILAVNGKDALDKLNGRNDLKINIVITDLNMPQMNGIEFIKQLRETSVHRFIPVVVLSTVLQEFEKHEFERVGVSEWLNKPFTAKQLINTVRKFVK